MKEKTDIVELFENCRRKRGYVRVSAPMVRYSKLEFRSLLRKNNVDLCFTPMIIADSFCQSSNARQNEFTTNGMDKPLIVQFAAKDSIDMLTASELAYPYVDGVDINCGCPQKWAISAGYGCAILKDPDKLNDIIKLLRRNLPNSFSCSVKLRLLQKDVRTTVDLCRQLEMSGATFLTVHGRTPWEKTSEPVNIDAICDIKKSLKIPLIGNGDVKTLKNADRLYYLTNCDGIMSARGLLTNPTLFTGSDITTKACVQDWINLAYSVGDRITFQCFHHHLTFMMEKIMNKKLRVVFNNFTKKDEIYAFLNETYQIVPQVIDNSNSEIINDNLVCTYDDDLYKSRKANSNKSHEMKNKNYYAEHVNGKYFNEFVNINNENMDTCDDEIGQLNFMGSSIFDQ